LHEQDTNSLRGAIEHFGKSLVALPTLAAHMALGWCLWRVSRFREAQHVLEEGLALAQRLKAHDREAAFHLNLGNVAGSLGNWDDALLHFKSAERWSGVLKDNLGRAKALGNIGIVFFTKGNNEQALKYYREAFELHETLSPPDAAIDL